MISANAILDPVFMPLLKINPLLAIAVISFIITFIMTLIYKWMTDQKKMKELKDKLTSFQKEMKEARNDQKRILEINKEMMKINGEYMRHTMKPMLISWIPILIIFAWMATNLAYYPIAPGQEFNATLKFASGTTGEVKISAFPEGQLQILDSDVRQIENNMVTWNMKGEEGLYTLNFDFENKTYDKEVIITTGTKYITPVKKIGGELLSIEISNEPVKVNLFGLHLSWFWTYFILALIFNSVLRKLIKVY